MTSPNRPPSCDRLKPKLKECPFCTGGRVRLYTDYAECLGCRFFGPNDDPHGTKWNSIPRRSEVKELLRLVDDYYDVFKSVANKGEKMSDECLLKGIRQGELGCFSADMEQSIRSLTRLVETTNKLRKVWQL